MTKFFTAIVYALGALILILGFALAGVLVYLLSWVLLMFGIRLDEAK